MFLSSIVLAFGYTVAVGPSGFVTLAFKNLFRGAPWRIDTLPGIILIGGLSHAPRALPGLIVGLACISANVPSSPRRRAVPSR